MAEYDILLVPKLCLPNRQAFVFRLPAKRGRASGAVRSQAEHGNEKHFQLRSPRSVQYPHEIGHAIGSMFGLRLELVFHLHFLSATYR